MNKILKTLKDLPLSTDIMADIDFPELSAVEPLQHDEDINTVIDNLNSVLYALIGKLPPAPAPVKDLNKFLKFKFVDADSVPAFKLECTDSIYINQLKLQYVVRHNNVYSEVLDIAF